MCIKICMTSTIVPFLSVSGLNCILRQKAEETHAAGVSSFIFAQLCDGGIFSGRSDQAGDEASRADDLHQDNCRRGWGDQVKPLSIYVHKINGKSSGLFHCGERMRWQTSVLRRGSALLVFRMLGSGAKRECQVWFLPHPRPHLQMRTNPHLKERNFA